jgi:CBS domain-containing protein
VDVDLLAQRLMALLTGGPTSMREATLAELMVSPDLYPRLYEDQSATDAFDAIAAFAARRAPATRAEETRSALVFDRQGQLVGMVRFSDLMRLVLPRFLADAPYPTFLPGMFVAQCKVMGRRSFIDLMSKLVTVDLRAPLMAAVHLMVRHRLSALPVMDGKELVGILRDRAVVMEIARAMAEPG